MKESTEEDNAMRLKQQLDNVGPKYYKLLDEIAEMRSHLREHLSMVVAAFMGLIASLHKASSNVCLEWWFFICIVLCFASLVFLIISSFENLRNATMLSKNIKSAFDNAIENMKPINTNKFSSSSKKIYTILFWSGIVSLFLAIVIFCIINMPLWQ